MDARSWGPGLAIAAGLSLLGLFCPALASTPPPNAIVGEGLTAATWDEALDLARRHDKPILIDFFTEW